MTKTVKLEDSSNSITLGGVEVTENWENDINGFRRPDLDGGSVEFRALNLNQVKQTFQITVEMDDATTQALNSGDGTLGSGTKEDARDRLFTIAESGDLLTLTYGSRTFEGFVSKLEVEEDAEEESDPGYTFTIQFLVATPMNQ